MTFITHRPARYVAEAIIENVGFGTSLKAPHNLQAIKVKGFKIRTCFSVQ